MRFRAFLTDEEAEARARQTFMRAYDALPSQLRCALRECTWDVHVLQRLSPYMDCTALIERIRGIKSQADAQEFNRQYAQWRG